ncbi:MAG TPA: hypothetical protein VEQ41_02115 [Solirubrobacterales bacterium]|nr:hypothetical protein [Solirubrobacterales bacterium]
MPPQDLTELLRRLQAEARALAETGELARLHREDDLLYPGRRRREW